MIADESCQVGTLIRLVTGRSKLNGRSCATMKYVHDNVLFSSRVRIYLLFSNNLHPNGRKR
jgi:hypothetical protein